MILFAKQRQKCRGQTWTPKGDRAWWVSWMTGIDMYAIDTMYELDNY